MIAEGQNEYYIGYHSPNKNLSNVFDDESENNTNQLSGKKHNQNISESNLQTLQHDDTLKGSPPKINSNCEHNYRTVRIDALKERKKELIEKLKSLQEQRNKESKEITKSIAEINILSKEYKNMNGEVLKIDSEFSNAWKKYIVNFGKEFYTDEQNKKVMEIHNSITKAKD